MTAMVSLSNSLNTQMGSMVKESVAASKQAADSNAFVKVSAQLANAVSS